MVGLLRFCAGVLILGACFAWWSVVGLGVPGVGCFGELGPVDCFPISLAFHRSQRVADLN